MSSPREHKQIEFIDYLRNKQIDSLEEFNQMLNFAYGVCIEDVKLYRAGSEVLRCSAIPGRFELTSNKLVNDFVKKFNKDHFENFSSIPKPTGCALFFSYPLSLTSGGHITTYLLKNFSQGSLDNFFYDFIKCVLMQYRKILSAQVYTHGATAGALKAGNISNILPEDVGRLIGTFLGIKDGSYLAQTGKSAFFMAKINQKFFEEQQIEIEEKSSHNLSNIL